MYQLGILLPTAHSNLYTSTAGTREWVNISCDSLLLGQHSTKLGWNRTHDQWDSACVLRSNLVASMYLDISNLIWQVWFHNFIACQYSYTEGGLTNDIGYVTGDGSSFHGLISPHNSTTPRETPGNFSFDDWRIKTAQSTTEKFDYMKTEPGPTGVHPTRKNRLEFPRLSTTAFYMPIT